MKEADPDVVNHLVLAGLWEYVKEARVGVKKNQVNGYMTCRGLIQLRWLAEGPCVRLRRGPWWLLHLRVGKKLADYRADNGVFGPGSLQVVVSQVETPGRGYAFYADVDSDSPNMDLYHAMKHLAVVVGNLV